jgi:hypothetical protein
MAIPSHEQHPEDLATKAFLRASELIDDCREKKNKRLYLGHLSLLNRIPPLGSLSGLEELDLSSTSVTDLAALTDLAGLQRLYLSDTRVSDLGPIAALTSLRTLDVSGSHVADLEPLRRLNFLEHLNLSNILPVSASKSSTRSKVRNAFAALGFSGSHLDLGPLSALTHLQELDVSDTSIMDISPLYASKMLKKFLLSNTQVSDLLPLSELVNLEQLVLDRTQVADLSPLARLKNLRELVISFTLVADLLPVAELESLVYAAGIKSKGIAFIGCPISDPTLSRLAEQVNPGRTIETLNYLRQQRNLPQIDVLPELPNQGPGPHFIIREDGRIGQAPASALDEKGNNTERLKHLHPFLRGAARNLHDSISPNQHPALQEIARQYLLLVDRNLLEEIPFDALYGAGLRLENAAAVSDRKIADRLLPELEDPAREALDSVLGLHAPFILSTKAGVELTELADHYKRHPDEGAIRDAAVELGRRLEANPQIITVESATLVRETAEVLGRGAQPNRTATYAMSMITNILIVIVTGAIAGAAILGGGAAIAAVAGALSAAFLYASKDILKKSKAYDQLTESGARNVDWTIEHFPEVLGLMRNAGFERYATFIIENEALLRRIAGDRPQFRWLHKQVDWLKNNHEGKIKQKANGEA